MRLWDISIEVSLKSDEGTHLSGPVTPRESNRVMSFSGKQDSTYQWQRRLSCVSDIKHYYIASIDKV